MHTLTYTQTDVRETVSKSSSESVSYNGSVVKRTLTSSSPAITHTHTDFFVSPHAYPCPHHTSFFPCYITPLPHQHNDKLWQKLWRSLTRSSVLFRPANTHKRTHTIYTHMYNILTRIHAGFAVTDMIAFPSTESHAVESQQSLACFYIQINTVLVCLHYKNQIPQPDLRKPALRPVFTLICSPKMGEF